MKNQKAKAFFDQTEIYYCDNFNVKLRTEVISDFTANRELREILDIGCGNGSGSIPLLSEGRKLKLLDISEHMLRLAKLNVPEKFIPNVSFVQGDFSGMAFPENSQDLVLCLGVLAHIENPWIILEKISKITAKGGMFILQNSDAGHFYFKLIKFTGKIKDIFRKNRYGYAFNEIKHGDLESELHRLGFQIIKEYRYNQSFLFFSRLIPGKMKYRAIKRFFGTPDGNKNVMWGCERIYCAIKN